MKRLALLLALCFLLAGCAQQAPVSTPAPTPPPATASPASTPKPTPTPSPTPAPTEKPFELSDLEWMDLPLSTCFSRIGYAEKYKVLGVVFINSDPRIYLYYDFPKSEWEKFSTAESWGGYYNEHIKCQYSGERID